MGMVPALSQALHSLRRQCQLEKMGCLTSKPDVEDAAARQNPREEHLHPAQSPPSGQKPHGGLTEQKPLPHWRPIAPTRPGLVDSLIPSYSRPTVSPLSRRVV